MELLLLKEKNDILAIDLMLSRINYPECLKDISINQKASADALFEYRKTLTDKPYEYKDEKGEIIKYFGKEDNYKEEMIPKSKLKTWWEDMYKEILERPYQIRSAEILDDIDTSIRKNFIE